MGQALKSPLRIPALDHGIAESVDDLVVGTDDSRIAAKSLDQCWLVVDAKLAVEPSLHRFSRSQLPKGFKALSISHVLEVCSLQAPVQGAPAAAAFAERFCGGRVHAAVVGPILDSSHARREKPGADRRPENVARIGLLPRVRCLRSLISANTPPPNFPVARGGGFREASERGPKLV